MGCGTASSPSWWRPAATWGVSEWAGHNSVAFTLTRYGGLFENGSAEAVDRLEPSRRWRRVAFAAAVADD